MRFFVVALAVVASTFSSGASAQCVPEDPPTCLSATELQFCNTSNELQTAVCPDAIPGSECATRPCAGTGCGTDSDCVGTRGGTCVGIRQFFTEETEDDGLFATCEPGSACAFSFDSGVETCVATPASLPTCTQSTVPACDGTRIFACVGLSATSAFPAPFFVDCAGLGAGFTCDDTDGVSCTNPACGADGEGRCNNGTATVCDAGTVTSETDCLTFGQGCVDDGEGPFCPTVDPACGDGSGSCSGVTATICNDGQVSTTTDCSAIGRVCGADAVSGRIGCIIGGGNEGEGEGEVPADECESDSDCDDDETCEDGECEGERRRGGGDPIQPAPGLFSCAQSGALLPGVVVVGALALLLRRRRRA